VSGERRPACNQVAQPCDGPTPTFERRYLLLDVDNGSVVWESGRYGRDISFAGLTRSV
jgi:hypothetical protein